MATRRRSTRLAATDWIDAALDALCVGGLPGIAVEPLARTLGVTKGSFYWHFDDRSALVDAALQRWEEMSTVRRFADIDQAADAPERLRRLITSVLGDERTLAMDFAVQVAADDAVVARRARAVNRHWVDWLQRQYQQMGMDAASAHDRAIMAYSAYIGFLRLIRTDPDLVPDGQRRSAFARYLVQSLLPPGFQDGS